MKIHRRPSERGRYVKNRSLFRVSGCGQVKPERVRFEVSTTTVCPAELKKSSLLKVEVVLSAKNTQYYNYIYMYVQDSPKECLK